MSENKKETKNPVRYMRSQKKKRTQDPKKINTSYKEIRDILVEKIREQIEKYKERQFYLKSVKGTYMDTKNLKEYSRVKKIIAALKTKQQNK